MTLRNTKESPSKTSIPHSTTKVFFVSNPENFSAVSGKTNENERKTREMCNRKSAYKHVENKILLPLKKSLTFYLQKFY